MMMKTFVFRMNSLFVIGALAAIPFLPSCNKRPARVGGPQVGGAEQSPTSPMGPSMPSVEETGDIAPPSPGQDLVWKRYRAFEHGLSQGLELDAKTLCLEIGQESCIDKIHLTVLGGNDPFKAGLYERAQAPTVLSAIAIDRVVLSACSQRLELDRKLLTKAVVFKHFPLVGTTPDQAQVRALATELYQRILARNPDEAELKAISEMSTKGLANEKYALMLCYAIASSSENILL